MWRETLTLCEAFLCSYSANGNSGQIKHNLIENLKNVFLFPACNPPWYNQEEIQVHWWLLLWSWQILIKTGLYPKSNIYIFLYGRDNCFIKISLYRKKQLLWSCYGHNNCFFSRLAWIPNITYIIQILYFSRPAFSPKAT